MLLTPKDKEDVVRIAYMVLTAPDLTPERRGEIIYNEIQKAPYFKDTWALMDREEREAFLKALISACGQSEEDYRRNLDYLNSILKD
jgi:hypothetical protein